MYCVEPNQGLEKMIQYILESFGFSQKSMESGRALLEALEEKIPDLILLDAELPGEDAMKILDRLRISPALAHIPVILMSREDDLEKLTSGFEHGADDFVSGKTGSVEFVARIKAALRRSGYREPGRNRLRLDIGRHEVVADDQSVYLTLREFDVLEYLMEHKGNLVTKEELERHFWTEDEAQAKRYVTNCVQSIRKKLGKCGELIQITRGCGYRMTGDMEIRE